MGLIFSHFRADKCRGVFFCFELGGGGSGRNISRYLFFTWPSTHSAITVEGMFLSVIHPFSRGHG